MRQLALLLLLSTACGQAVKPVQTARPSKVPPTVTELIPLPVTPVPEGRAGEPAGTPLPVRQVSASKPIQAVREDKTGSATRTVTSTAYCLRGTMANGQPVGDGWVAMNGVPFGSRWLVLSGPLAGRTFTVGDRIGHGSMFDVWMASCTAARTYGRRTIRVQRV